MTCPHSTKDSRGCTQCLGIVPQRVTLDGARILVDGVDSGRTLDHERVITARRTRKR